MEGGFAQLVSQLLEVEAELIQELTSLQEEELDLAITGHRRARDLRQFLQHHIYHAWDHIAHTVKTRNELGIPRDEVNVLVGDLLAARGQLTRNQIFIEQSEYAVRGGLLAHAQFLSQVSRRNRDVLARRAPEGQRLQCLDDSAHECAYTSSVKPFSIRAAYAPL